MVGDPRCEGASAKERDGRVAQLESKLLELQTELTQTSRTRNQLPAINMARACAKKKVLENR